MASLKTSARRIGVLYFLLMILGIEGEFLFPVFMVPEDAAATAHNITVAEQTYRIGILTDFISFIVFIALAASLYKLLKNIDKWHAMLMVLLVSIGITVSIANQFNKFAPLILLSGADYLSVFTKPQLDALALGFLKFHGSASAVSTAFWGLWLFPFGTLVIKSGFIPKLFGILLIVAGVGYVLSSCTAIAFPDYRHTVNQIMMPLYFGEMPIIFWLLIKGVRTTPQEAQTSPVS